MTLSKFSLATAIQKIFLLKSIIVMLSSAPSARERVKFRKLSSHEKYCGKVHDVRGLSSVPFSKCTPALAQQASQKQLHLVSLVYRTFFQLPTRLDPPQRGSLPRCRCFRALPGDDLQ